MLTHCCCRCFCFCCCCSLCVVRRCRCRPLTRSTSSQYRAHRSPLTKIPTCVPRASLDSPRPSSAEPRGSPLLQRLSAKVGGRRRCAAAAGGKSKILSVSHSSLPAFCIQGSKVPSDVSRPKTGGRIVEPGEEVLGAAPRLHPEPPRLP